VECIIARDKLIRGAGGESLSYGYEAVLKIYARAFVTQETHWLSAEPMIC
jgi:hypothetical protein